MEGRAEPPLLSLLLLHASAGVGPSSCCAEPKEQLSDHLEHQERAVLRALGHVKHTVLEAWSRSPNSRPQRRCPPQCWALLGITAGGGGFLAVDLVKGG